MNIIVTGNNGFLGRNLTRKLLQNGQKVYGFARSRTKDQFASKHKNFKQIKTDLRSFNAVKKACKSIRDVKYVFHMATMHPTASKKEIWGYLNINFIGAANLLNACNESGFRNIIASSSFSIYGQPKYLPIDERHPTCPVNFYGLTKLQADLLFEFYARKNGFNIIILRYDGIYGRGQSVPGFIQYIFKAFSEDRDVELFNYGRQKRDNVYVGDVVKANLAAMRLVGRERYNIFNIGGGQPESALKRAKIVKEALNSKSQIILSKKNNPLMNYDIFLDITKARRVLGYRPKGLRDNINDMINKVGEDAERI